MSLDFFGTDCGEPPRNENLFGICDDQDGTKAYTETQQKDKWIATIKNDNQITVTFTAIDNCIIILKKGTQNKESSCDGMLTFKNSIFLIELKNQGTGGWLPTAKNQLKNTIKLLEQNINLNDFKYKKAYACNRRHPSFTTIDNEYSKRFFKETNGFRIDAQAEIVIK